MLRKVDLDDIFSGYHDEVELDLKEFDQRIAILFVNSTGDDSEATIPILYDRIVRVVRG